MAAHDFYNPARPNQPPARQRSDASLPSIPAPHSAYSAYQPLHHAQATASPISPLGHDPAYPAYAYQSQQSLGSEHQYYGGAGGGRLDEPTPYSDDIPLQPHAQSNYSPDGSRQDQWRLQEENNNNNLARLSNRTPSSRGRRRKKRGLFSGRIPWVVYGLTLIQVTVFIAEIVKNAVLTKSPIEIHPQVNPMLGPSIYVLINMGARYVPCMRSTPGIQDSSVEIAWPCPNTTTSDPESPSNQCTLSEFCGFSGVPNPHPGGSLSDIPQPNQWFRFIVPIFLHAGFIHITFNMLTQLTIGREMEKEVGSLRFALIYFSSGIFGFIMGGNFAPSGVASTGASGSLFGVIAIMLLHLLYTWKEQDSPGKELIFVTLVIVISFVLGLLPGLDNFSHIGGFVMGLFLGICILHSPIAIRQHANGDSAPYAPVDSNRRLDDSGDDGLKGLVRQPLGFFRNRKPIWWLWCIVRVVALVGVLVCFIVLLTNFYKYRTTCSWCKYLSCLPHKNWCEVGNIQLTNTTSTPNRRDLFGIPGPMVLDELF